MNMPWRAATLLLLSGMVPAALAQGANGDLVGAYPVTVSTDGNCTPGPPTTVDVTEVTADSVRMHVANTGQGPQDLTARFDPASLAFAGSFPIPFPEAIGSSRVRYLPGPMQGRFARSAGAVGFTLSFTPPRVIEGQTVCTVTLQGSRPVTALASAGAAEGNAPAGEETAAAAPPADSAEVPTTSEASATGGDESDGSDATRLILLAAAGLLVLGGATAYTMRRRAVSAGAPASGEPGANPPPNMIASVAVDRLGGIEDSLSYGNEGGKSAPVVSAAYPALAVGQSPRTSQGEPLINPTGGTTPDKPDPRDDSRKRKRDITR